MKNAILSLIPTECPWRDTLYWFDTLDSTNNRLKELAAEGASHGTVVIAEQQTGGRGRMGRSFHSPAGKGVYLSVLLRPRCQASELMHLTCAAAVATCDGIENATGYRPEIKWINDLVGNGKKLGGILTELSLDPKSGTVPYAIVGIGINCRHTAKDFPQELKNTATSLEALTGKTAYPEQIAAAIVTALYQTDANLLNQKVEILARYRENCITLNKQIVIHKEKDSLLATAIDIDENGCLVVRYPDGSIGAVNSGEVSIRALTGYV